MTDEPMRTTAELRCPFLDCKSEKVASVGYGKHDTSSGKSAHDFNERLFQCQECERKFVYIGDLSLNNDRESARRVTMANKEAYREKLEAQMREWSAKIDLLKAKADQAEAEAKVEYRNRIEDLRQKKEALRVKLGELQNASDAAWKDIKTGTEKAAADLKDALRSALAKFKQ
jgi:hypothetical protein